LKGHGLLEERNRLGGAPVERVRLAEDGQRPHRLTDEVVLATDGDDGLHGSSRFRRCRRVEEEIAAGDRDRHAAIQVIRGGDDAVAVLEKLQRAVEVTQLHE
jgi:hypothetical protein